MRGISGEYENLVKNAQHDRDFNFLIETILLSAASRFERFHNESSMEKTLLGREWPGIKHMDGMISADDFKSSSLQLIDAWAMHCNEMPSWHWNESNGHSLMGVGYLSLEDVPFDNIKSLEEECFRNVLEINENDPETVLPSYVESYVFTYHVVYNEIFRVPKLFLRGRHSDGRPLPWEDVQKILPAGSYQENAKWTFLTYEEHPYLHMPWLALHPCGTSELMSTVLATLNAKSSVNCGEFSDDDCKEDPHNDNKRILQKRSNMYILAWLSFVSQATPLKLPTGFSKCFCMNLNT